MERTTQDLKKNYYEIVERLEVAKKYIVEHPFVYHTYLPLYDIQYITLFDSNNKIGMCFELSLYKNLVVMDSYQLGDNTVTFSKVEEVEPIREHYTSNDDAAKKMLSFMDKLIQHVTK